MHNNLTPRELQVLRLITLGYSNSQIAKILSITLHTVKAHVQAILYKLRVKNRVQAAVFATKYIIEDLEKCEYKIDCENLKE